MNNDLDTCSGLELCLHFAAGLIVRWRNAARYRILAIERESGTTTQSYNLRLLNTGEVGAEPVTAYWRENVLRNNTFVLQSESLNLLLTKDD